MALEVNARCKLRGVGQVVNALFLRMEGGKGWLEWACVWGLGGLPSLSRDGVSDWGRTKEARTHC